MEQFFLQQLVVCDGALCGTCFVTNGLFDNSSCFYPAKDTFQSSNKFMLLNALSSPSAEEPGLRAILELTSNSSPLLVAE